MIDRRRFVGLAGATALASPFVRSQRASAGQLGPTALCVSSCRFRRAAAPTPSRASSPWKLSAIWGQEMVIENKGGGATNIGTDSVAKADPDGYTVLLQSVPLGVNRFLMNSLPFDPVADLAPVSLICDYPNIMAVPMSSPATTVKEFIDYAKENPGKLTYASSGYGTSVHLSGELFNRMTNSGLMHVPYRGAGPAFNDLIPGRVHVMFNNSGAVLPFIHGQKTARARRHLRQAHAGAAGCSDHCGGRRARLRRHRLVRFLRAGQDSAGDRREIPQGHGDGARRSGDPAAARSARCQCDWVDARRARGVSEIRDGQMGSAHQVCRHQSPIWGMP